jgi:hypothetical protein
MALATMISLDRIRVGFAHDQSLRWDHRGIHLPMIGAVEYHLPSGQAINELLQGCGITTPTLPVKEVAYLTIKSLPDPEFMPFFEKVPHLIDFEDNGYPDGFRFGRVFHGEAPDPLEYGTHTVAEHLPQRVHGNPVTIEEHSQRLLPQGSPPWRGARELIATAPTEPALVAPGHPGLDHVRMRTFRTGVHASPRSLW